MPHQRRIGLVVILVSLALIAFATLLPEEGNPVPSLCIICGTFGGVDAILNVLLFVPLGVGLALVGVRWRHAFLTVALLSMAIETAQLVAIPGRDATIGDVLTNTLGGSLGFLLTRRAKLWLLPSRSHAKILAIGWGIFWIVVQTTSSYGLSPSLPSSTYHGQLARALDIFARFEGKILSASIDGEKVPDWAFPNSAQTRRELLNHAIVSTVVAADGPAQDLAPIIRVADEQKREILILAQDGRSMVFGIRTGAADLRLRNPLFALRNVFPDSLRDATKRDTLVLRTQFLGDRVELMGDGRTRIQRMIPIRSSLGWALVAPAEWYIDWRLDQRVLSVLWITLLMIPLGYWAGAFIARGSGWLPHAAASVRWILGGIALLAIGFTLIPQMFGLAPEGLVEWLSGIAGFGAGVLCIRLALREPRETPQ